MPAEPLPREAAVTPPCCQCLRQKDSAWRLFVCLFCFADWGSSRLWRGSCCKDPNPHQKTAARTRPATACCTCMNQHTCVCRTMTTPGITSTSDTYTHQLAPTTTKAAARLSDSLVWQGCAALQVGLDLCSVLAKRALDLLVEVCIARVDVVHVCIRPERAAPAERCTLRLLGVELRHHGVQGIRSNLCRQGRARTQGTQHTHSLVRHQTTHTETQSD